MKCPRCGEKARVKDIVHTPEMTYRRLQCKVCRHIFHSTEERADMTEERQTQWNKWHRRNSDA